MFRSSVLVSGVVLIIAASGCTWSGEQPPSSSMASSTPSTTEPSAEDAALTAYQNMWDVVVDASHSGEASPAELDKYASGDALALMQQTLEGARDEGVTVVGRPTMNPEVTESATDTVVVLDCVDDSRWVEQEGSGSSETDGSSQEKSRKVDATVSSDSLAWRVSKLRIWEHGTC